MKHNDELLDKLPKNLQTIIQLTDYRTAMILIDHFGGRDYKFPALRNISESHELAALLGFNNLRKLCQFWNGDTIYIPNAGRYEGALRTKRIEQDLDEIGSHRAAQEKIARKYGVSERWVREINKQKVQAKPKKASWADRQLDMFPV